MVREADSFTKLCELQKDYDQDSYCWKTYQHSLFGGLETYSEPWPRSGMIRSGIAYRLRPLPARPTSETGSSYWPTPRASEYKDCGPLGSKSYLHMLDRSYLCAKAQEADNVSGKLNPNWVEWLMGFPSGWTELNEQKL